MKSFALDTSNSGVATVNGVKYYYDKDTATAYFMEDGKLAGLPQYGEGEFTLEESFLVEVNNNSLKTEVTGDGQTLGVIWRKAERILGGNNIVINKVYKSELNDNSPFAVEILIDCDKSHPDEGSSEMEWFETDQEQAIAYHKALKDYGVEA